VGPFASSLFPADRAVRGACAVGVATLALLLAFVHGTPSETVWIVDCGSKALQARQLLDTGFRSLELSNPSPRLDPEGLAFPIPAPFAVRRGGGFVSQYPIAYAALAAPALAALGEPGLRLPAALGAAACALLFTLWAAPALGAAWATAGGGVLALASPLVFYGVTIWEHSLTVALSLLAAWLATRAGAGRLVAAGLCVGAAAWLREELALVAPALALGAYLQRRRLGEVAWLAAGAAPLGAALVAFNLRAFGHPLGVHVGENVGLRPSLTATQALGDLGAVLAGAGATPGEGAWLAAALLAAVLAGAALAWRGRRLWCGLAVCLGLGLAAWGVGFRALAVSPHPLLTLTQYNGLLVQMPAAALAGMGSVLVWRDPGLAPLRLGVAAGLTFLVLALALRVSVTPFATGGHWGPRMLLPALPALAALALASLRAGLGSGATAGRRLAGVGAAALVTAGLASSVLALRLLDSQKRDTLELQQAILAAPPEVAVTNHPALGAQLPALWTRKPLLLVRDAAALRRLAAGLQQRGVERWLYVWRPTLGPPPDAVSTARCRRMGVHRGRRVPQAFDVDLLVCGERG
jgi:hypothetical protein